MKVEVAVDATGIPVGVATDAANVPETELGGVALASIPRAIAVPGAAKDVEQLGMKQTIFDHARPPGKDRPSAGRWRLL